MPDLFHPAAIGSETFALMNLSHPEVEKRIMAEMSRGVAVYYDVRWETTAVLTDWLAQNFDLFREKKVLVLGAGVGAETLILGRHASELWINDLSGTALELCQEQLRENGITHAVSLCGRYERLDLPEVDLVVASFLVYNDDTYRAMGQFMKGHQGHVILVNEALAPFPTLRKEREHEILFEKGPAIGCLFGNS